MKLHEYTTQHTKLPNVVSETSESIQFRDFELIFGCPNYKQYLCFVSAQGSKLCTLSPKFKPLTPDNLDYAIALDHEFNVIRTASKESEFEDIIKRASTYRNNSEKIMTGILLPDNKVSIKSFANSKPVLYDYTTHPAEENTSKVLVQTGQNYTENELVYVTKKRKGLRVLNPVFILTRNGDKTYSINRFMTDKWIY